MASHSHTRPLSRPVCRILRKGGGARIAALPLAVLLVSVAIGDSASAAQAPVGLGTAGSFAVLASSTVTNTGPSMINGDLGVSPGTAVTGISGPPNGTVNGTTHTGDAVAAQAEADVATAYKEAAGAAPTAPPVTGAATDIGDGSRGGLPLDAGVYKYDSSAALTTSLTLDAQGNPNAAFIFQVGSTLTTASGIRVNVINDPNPNAAACNVLWQVGSSATLGTATQFIGNIMASQSITLTTGATIFGGRALALNGAVTMDDNTITAARCSTTGTGTTKTGTTGTGTTGTGTTGTGTTGTGTTGTGTTGGAGGGRGGLPGATAETRDGTVVISTSPPSVAKTIGRFGTSRCVRRTFRVLVTGHLIRRVGFSVGGRTIAIRTHPPFAALIRSTDGIHTVSAHVTFTNGARAVTVHLRFKPCAAAKRHVISKRPVGPVGFTG